MKLSRNVKKTQESILQVRKQKQKENIGPLLNRRGESVTSNTEKEEVLNAFFMSVFTSTVGAHALGTKTQVDTNINLPSVKKEFVCQLLQQLDPYKLIDPDNNHLRVRDLADIFAGCSPNL